MTFLSEETCIIRARLVLTGFLVLFVLLMVTFGLNSFSYFYSGLSVEFSSFFLGVFFFLITSFGRTTLSPASVTYCALNSFSLATFGVFLTEFFLPALLACIII